MVQESPFLTAADGDESSESITSFSETLDDDVLFYPDAFDESTIDLADDGGSIDPPLGSGAGSSGDHTDTFVLDGVAMYDVSSTDDMEIWVNFTVPTGDYEINGFTYALYYKGKKPDITVHLYDYTAGDWGAAVDTQTNDNTYKWANGSCYDSDFWNTEVAIEVHGTFAPSISQAFIDYAEVTWSYMHLADSDHYAESFADVSDWALRNCEGDASFTTDGDQGSFQTDNGASDSDSIRSDITDISAESYYYEFRYWTNVSCNIKVQFLDQALSTVLQVDQWGCGAGDSYTRKKIITTSTDIGWIYLIFDNQNKAIRLKPDYMRIGPPTEMGWQHDCSTTEGVTDGGGGSSSSDGSELTLTADSDGSVFEFVIDTTATAAYLDADYYPMIGLDFNDADSADYVKVESYDGSAWATVIANTTIGTDTLYANCRAADADIAKFRISVNPSANPRLKWFKAFSIANYTVTNSGAGVNDVTWVESGILHHTESVGSYVRLSFDPAISTNTATFNVWNATVSDPGGGFRFREYVGAWKYFDVGQTRGALTSGTMTHFEILLYATMTVSAIKFIEDGTAPSVLRISATPPEPDDTESVTLSALATDTVEVYKVWFRPITGPTGYSQTDYESTEQADNLWTYEFASLDEGYWAFKAIANDGANNSTLDADSVTDFWVREKELIISNTLYTETSTQCSFAGQTNVACDYLIYDDDAEQESGNKAAGSFFLDWTKQTSVGTHDWGIKFYTASDTDWHNGSYEVLTTTLLVTEYGIRTTDSYAYLNGYVTLDSNYKVYEEMVEVGTGSVSAGSFEIRWTKASSSVENVTVLFESGTQSYPVYSGYDVAEQATFVVESWWMDLNLGVESYVEFYVLSSFENATVYVYDNNTLMTTVTESAGGAYSYFWLSESEGLHTITLNITHGATVHSRIRTYYVPDWAATGLVVRWDLWTFQDNYTMLELGSNWMNCTYYVYLNSSLVATSANDPVTLNFTRTINIGEYNLTIFANASAQTYTIKNIRYIITEEGVSYDYSQVTGGRSVRYGDNYNYYTVTTEEPAPGILIDQTTAAIVSVGGFLIIFTAFLAARELRKREILKTERIFGK